MFQIRFAKVTVIWNGLHVTGHVVSESCNNIIVLLSSKKVVNLRSPWCEEIFVNVKKRVRYCVVDSQVAGKVDIVCY